MYNAAQLVKMSMEHAFKLGPYTVVSQDPNSLSPLHRQHVVPHFLPQLIRVWRDVESVTGYRWRCTSYLRDSPSHRRGHAIDLAPQIASKARHLYAVHNGSDPVLYKRAPLIRALQKLTGKDYSLNGSNDMGIFLEPDHLHVQILAPDPHNTHTAIVKWGIEKPIYSDSAERMKLPVTDEGYLALR